MSIEQYIDNCAKSLGDIDGVNKVQRFGGQFSENDLKTVNLSNNGCVVLVTGIGGALEENPSGNLDCDANFAAFVIAKADRDTIGHSSNAATIATNITNHIHKNSREWAGANRTKAVELLELSERDNPIGSGTSYGIWQVFWSQRIILSADK